MVLFTGRSYALCLHCVVPKTVRRAFPCRNGVIDREELRSLLERVGDGEDEVPSVRSPPEGRASRVCLGWWRRAAARGLPLLLALFPSGHAWHPAKERVGRSARGLRFCLLGASVRLPGAGGISQGEKRAAEHAADPSLASRLPLPQPLLSMLQRRPAAACRWHERRAHDTACCRPAPCSQSSPTPQPLPAELADRRRCERGACAVRHQR